MTPEDIQVEAPVNLQGTREGWAGDKDFGGCNCSGKGTGKDRVSNQ
jgi:hypothetical protein